jgi:hypothetical protein
MSHGARHANCLTKIANAFLPDNWLLAKGEITPWNPPQKKYSFFASRKIELEIMQN